MIKLHEPDIKEKFFFFISGIIVSIPFTILFEILAYSLAPFTSNFYAALWASVIVAPFVEEFAKAYPLFYRHGETKKSIFILGSIVGLGFGISEFFIYVFLYGAPVLVRLLGIFFHAASTSIVSYGIATKRSWQFYLVAVFLHFSNNLFSLFGNFWLIGGIGTIALTYILSLHIYYRVKG